MTLTKRELGFLRLLDRDQYTVTSILQPDQHETPVRSVCMKPADVFGIYFPEKGRIAHVGFVEQWKEHWLITVEGNTTCRVIGKEKGYTENGDWFARFIR